MYYSVLCLCSTVPHSEHSQTISRFSPTWEYPISVQWSLRYLSVAFSFCSRSPVDGQTSFSGDANRMEAVEWHY